MQNVKFALNSLTIVNIHKNSKKCTIDQIMLYNQAIQLHKTINHTDFQNTFEQITVVDQAVCTDRQLKLFRNNSLILREL